MFILCDWGPRIRILAARLTMNSNDSTANAAFDCTLTPIEGTFTSNLQEAVSDPWARGVERGQMVKNASSGHL